MPCSSRPPSLTKAPLYLRRLEKGVIERVRSLSYVVLERVESRRYVLQYLVDLLRFLVPDQLHQHGTGLVQPIDERLLVCDALLQQLRSKISDTDELRLRL